MANEQQGTPVAPSLSRREGRLRVSIRLRVSLTLLVSALNGIFMFGVVFAVWASLNEEGPDARDVLALITETSALNERLHADEPQGLEEGFDALVSNLESVGVEDATVFAAVAAWRLTAMEALLADRPDDLMDVAHMAHRQVLGQLRLLLDDTAGGLLTRTPWLLESLFAWVVIYAVLMVVSAWEVNRTISGPLARLADEARRVAGGDLDRAIDPTGDSPELLDISAALEEMRRTGAAAIARLDLRQRRTSAMLAALTNGVMLIEGDRLLVWNPAAQALLARLPGQRTLKQGAALAEFLPEAPYPLPTMAQLPIDLETKQGPLHFTLVASQLPDGQHALVLEDVTEAVEVENLKRDFLSVVTHELKTPLTAVKGFLKLLLMGKGGALSPKQTDLLQRAQKGADQLLKMVQDLLDATRLEGGQLSLHPGPVDPAKAAREVVATFSAEAETLGLVLEVDAPDELPNVLADNFRLAQVLGNLVRNAMKFTDEGGRIVVRAGVIGEEALLAVQDTGRGIPAHALPHLFEKFYQVERGDRRRQGGAGLGLTICKQLVEAMAGRIAVVSTEGEGTTVTLHFPLRRSVS